MAIKSYEEYLKEVKAASKAQQDADIAASDKNFEGQKTRVTDTYNREIDSTAKSYESLYDENNVQKLINEKEIAENMANLGLTDSGLNRTQQTAAQLSYANAKNKIDIERQKSIDSLTAALADKITQLDLEKANAAASITSQYDSAARSSAENMYNTAVKQKYEYDLKMAELAAEQAEAAARAAESQRQADIEARYIIKANGGLLSRNFSGTLADNGVAVYYNGDGTTTYVDSNSGKKTTMQRGVNPYTGGNIHKDLLKKDGSYDSSKAFSNGYQPNNIDGYKLKKYDSNAVTINGNTQSVWVKVKGHNKEYYVWNGALNTYIPVVKNSNGEWIIK